MRILFVCLGNICRSPSAEAVMRHYLQQAGLAERVHLDSAGTGDWHIGKAPDARARRAGQQRGYDLDSLRARQVTSSDFQQFDLILAMDRSNLTDLERLRPALASAELDLFLQRYQLAPAEVPDPYYGGPEGFEQVLDLLEQGCEALTQEITGRL